MFYYDYVLTFGDESSGPISGFVEFRQLKHIWGRGRFSIGSILFVLARYLGFASCVLSNFEGSHLRCAGLRVTAIISSEAIVAVRTWAVWARNKWILAILVLCAIAACTAAGVTTVNDVQSSERKSSSTFEYPAPDCVVGLSTSVGGQWVVPLSMTIMYEVVTIVLTIIRIMWWRRRLSRSRSPNRAPLLDTLWKDGVIYFALMLALGVVNTALVIRSTAAVIQQNVTQLQTSLHSILSTRIVLHLANSGVGVKQMHTATSSYDPDDIQFSTVLRTTDIELSTYDVGPRP
ncbi:hypothetical protein PC9H_011368 [Pleurotus ostreatus]|uniref:DUF6533 domain-containing protein n=1 Tax=Pleurotus ostreatus TaxID=5322 RepID=A0A8H7DLE2_PLEOS|nr:uncharacterized protein PC9H_011368 [Pleurotus ostreatus]KAF7420850.1 hypothetical protein PC9H_011368 [Pleurotus ostreatus]